MNFLKRAWSSIDAVLDRVLCVIGAVVFSQAPEFMQQYLQRLGGHLDEARRILAQYEGISRFAGISLDDYIARTNANPDTAVAKLGGVMEGAVTRVHDLTAAHDAIQNASPFTRPLQFLWHIDSQIADGAWRAFKPGVPVTLEGFAYAFAGVLVALAVYHLCIQKPITAIRRRRAGDAPLLDAPSAQ